MKRIEIIRKLFWIAGVFILYTMFISCEKNKYDLLDPVNAGVWNTFNTTNGLPGNGVNDIKLDSNGTLWVAFSSGSGLASFDGISWTTYKTSNSGILSNYVTCLEADNHNNIVIGTTDGLSFRTGSNEWFYFQLPGIILRINDIKITSAGDMYFGTYNKGLYYADNSGFSFVDSTIFKNVTAIEEDKSGNIWFGTNNGLMKWDGSNISLLTTANGLPSNEIKSLFCDSRSRLWIGTTGGQTVSWLGSDNVLHQVSLFNGPYGAYVRSIFEDRRGYIWFATWFDGLISYDGVIPKSYKEFNGFPENDINAIGEDKSGNLWFGLYSKGLVKYSLPLE
jgi:ligand-binding sensor domain-containing protein